MKMHAVEVILSISALLSISVPIYTQAASGGPALSQPATAPSEAVPQRDVNPPGQLMDPTSGAGGSLFEVHGTVFERYREDTSRDASTRSLRGFVTYGNANLTYNPAPVFSVYVRFGFELQSPRTGGRDYNTNYYQGTTGFRGAANFDRYGAVYHDARRGLTINLGRQDEALDASGTLYNQSFKVGLHTFLDGIALIQRLRSSTVQVYAFSEDQYRTRDTRNGLYALRGTYKPSKAVTLGLTLAHFASSIDNSRAGVATTTNYEGDVVLAQGASQLTLEYAKSNAKTQNDLYYVGNQYRLTARYHYDIHLRSRQKCRPRPGHRVFQRKARHALHLRPLFSTRIQGVLFYEAAHKLARAEKNTSTRVTLLYSF